MNYFKAKRYILDRLKDELPNYLAYHGYHHTLDVYEMTIDIAKEEGVHDEEELTMLKTAALYHDSGFLSVYKGHEEVSCLLVKEILPHYEYNDKQIEVICSMIMATQIPQHPTTKLEEILADADLDYLGRDDFYPIADSLYQELKSIEAVQNVDEWNRIQISFLEEHHYYTRTCIERRKAEKDKRLEELKQLMTSK